MNDDQMDEMLIHGARDYNQPGEIPREEMWKRVQAARTQATRPAPIAHRASRVWTWTSVGIAAALVLSVGIVIGRRMDRSAPSTQPAVAVNPIVAKPVPGRDSVIEQIKEETKKTGRRVQELAQAAPRVPSTDSRSSSTDQSLAYRLVVLRHLAGSEAMITSFRSGARSGEVDAQLAAWSRELLGTTRLLESSQAASDPVMRRLLEDLDLVISQIVQYTTRGTTNADELDLIEQSINKRGVMNKLRSTIPARTTSGI